MPETLHWCTCGARTSHLRRHIVRNHRELDEGGREKLIREVQQATKDRRGMAFTPPEPESQEEEADSSESQDNERVDRRSIQRQVDRAVELGLDRSHDIQGILPGFEEFMRNGPKQLAETTVKMYLKYIGHVLYLVDPKEPNPELLRDLPKVRAALVEFQEKTRAGPSGMQSRVAAVIMYLRHRLDSVQMDGTTDMVLQERVWSALLERYTKFHRSFRAQRARQEQLRRVEDEEKDEDRTTAHKLQTNRPIQQRLERITEKAQAGQKLRRTDYNFLVRYLIAMTTYTHSQRPGAVLNMTNKEVRRGKKRQRDNVRLMVRVWDHKTAAAHAAATLFFEPSMQRLLHVYQKKVRPKDGDKQFFFHQNGRRIPSRHHGRELKRAAKTFGMPLPSATVHRKATSSAARNKLASTEAYNIAKAMGHSVTTAERFYQNVGGRKKGEQAFELLASLAKPSPKNQKKTPQAKRRAVLLSDSESENEERSIEPPERSPPSDHPETEPAEDSDQNPPETSSSQSPAHLVDSVHESDSPEYPALLSRQPSAREMDVPESDTSDNVSDIVPPTPV